MLIRIGPFEFTEVWDGVLYKKLSGYPAITDWEKRTLVEFADYEHAHGRDCPIECDDAALLAQVRAALAEPERYRSVPRPELITECTACPVRKGCATEYVCHTASPENAASILRSGRLLSAAKARGLPAEVLMTEARNAAGDPADYFDYVMFTWGNCQAGDRLVMERKLGRFPNEEDLSLHFTPGVRFYFRYDELIRHPRAVFDGVLPLKVQDEIILADWVQTIVIPCALESSLAPLVPPQLQDRIVYVENDCRDIWAWSEKVYRTILQRGRRHAHADAAHDGGVSHMGR